LAVPPVAVEFTVEGLDEVKAAFGEVSNASRETKQSVEQDSKVMAAGLRILGREIFIVAQTGRLVTEFAEQFGILDKKMADALGRGFSLVSMMGGLASSLSMLARITQTAAAAEWMHVVALKAKAVAAAIAHGIASLGVAVPIIAAAAVAATAIALAATAQVPSKEHGGIIEKTGIYQLHKGELVIPHGAYEHPPRQQPLTLIFDIHDNRFASDYDADRTGDRIVDRLRRAGVI